jgi:hypothetical protein
VARLPAHLAHLGELRGRHARVRLLDLGPLLRCEDHVARDLLGLAGLRPTDLFPLLLQRGRGALLHALLPLGLLLQPALLVASLELLHAPRVHVVLLLDALLLGQVRVDALGAHGRAVVAGGGGRRRGARARHRRDRAAPRDERRAVLADLREALLLEVRALQVHVPQHRGGHRC